MPTIDTTNTLSSLSTESRQQGQLKNNELGQDAFLELMITQMNNQNPLEPQSNSEFVAQLAQFSTVEGIEKMNTSLDGLSTSFLSSQALQATSLVGRTVKIPAETAQLESTGSIDGTVALPASASGVTLRIYDSANVLVEEQSLGPQTAGYHKFSWDGTDGDGNRLSSGAYRFEATAAIDGEQQPVETALSSNVDSVTIGANGTVILNVAGVGEVPMSQLVEIL